MPSIDRRIWDWLPGRTQRNRVTDHHIAAANLGITDAEAVAAYQRLEAAGHIVRDRAGWHRGSEPQC